MSAIVPPRRSPRETLGGYVILPRLIDTVRLHARGELPADYLPQLLGPELTLDGRFLGFTGVDREALRAAILAAPDDAAVLTWVERHAAPHTLDEKRAWADAIDAYRPDPERVARRAKAYPNVAARFDVGAISVFDLIDLDEGRIDRTTWQLTIEFLYLDRSRCTRCQATDAVLDDALAEVAADLRAASLVVDVRKIHVRTEEQARQLGFVSSPTIRINGRDIAPEIRESACKACSCGCEGEGVACRVWHYQGNQYNAPPKALIVDAIRQAIADPDRWTSQAVTPLRDVPENLKRFFAANQRAASDQCCG